MRAASVAGVGCALVASVAGLTSASAQTLLLGGAVEGSSGIAAGGPVARVLRRSRTTLRIAVDGRNDEEPKTAWSAGVLAEIEPRAALGLDAHLLRAVGTHFWAGIGAVGFVAPKTLLGVSAFGAYRLPIATGAQFSIGPAFQLFALGSDLPSAEPIWQATLRVGIHVDL